MTTTSTKEDLMNSLMMSGGGGDETTIVHQNGFGNVEHGSSNDGTTTHGVTDTAVVEEEDLFGGIPIIEAATSTANDAVVVTVTPPIEAAVVPPSAGLPTTPLPNNPPPPPPPVAAEPSSTAASSLFGSILLEGNNISGDGGGLFDDIDQAEEAATAAAAAEAEAQRLKELAIAEAQRAATAAHIEAQQAAAAVHAEAQRAAAAAQVEAQRVAAIANEEAERLRRQQVQDQMQSIHLGNANNNISTIGPTMLPSNNSMYGGVGMPQQQQPYNYNTNSPSSGMGGYPAPQQQQQAFSANNNSNVYPPQPPQQYPYQQQAPQPSVYPPPPSQQQQQQESQQQQQQSHVLPDMQQQQQQQPRYYQPSAMGNPTAGMYNGGSGGNMMYQQQQQQQIPNQQMYMQQQQQSLYQQPPRNTIQHMTVPMGLYHRVLVTEPLLVQSPNGGGISLFGIGGSTPHWSYQITTELNAPPQPPNNNNDVPPPPPPSGGGGVWMVRRRFRHVVALEDRLREDCPGAILPPRPEKHASRAIEEVGAQQSAEFAMQRALELQNYLNLLIHHPYAQQSVVLRLFLFNQDDLGSTWPEVSNNAFTRLANASVGAAVKVSETTAGTKLPWHDQGMIEDFGEDNAELIALQNGESIRMGAVLQAVPKLEGAATLLREQAEQTLAVAMEYNRVAKDLEITDRDLFQPVDLLSAGMLRAGRRSKRLVMELAAAVQSYSNQYKLCRYERMAFADRKNAIIRRQKERGRADHRAAQLLFHQRQQHHLASSQQYYGNNSNGMDRMAQDAAMMDDFATDVNQECEEIGRRLKQEVNRIAWNRKIEWNASVKVIASAMKEAATERVAIWETIRESFLKAYPDYAIPTSAPASGEAPVPQEHNNASAINPIQQHQTADPTTFSNPISPSPLGY